MIMLRTLQRHVSLLKEAWCKIMDLVWVLDFGSYRAAMIYVIYPDIENHGCIQIQKKDFKDDHSIQSS